MNTSLLSSLPNINLSNLSNMSNISNMSNMTNIPDLSKINYNTVGLDAVLLPDSHNDLVAKVNNLLNDTLSNTDLMCNKECQQNKKEEQLFQSYINAKNNLTNAPKTLEIAERDFITFTEGGIAYQQKKEKEFSKKADTIIQALQKMYDAAYKQTTLFLNTYKDQLVYDNHITELTNTYSDKLNKLEMNVENTQSKYNVTNRLTEYKLNWIQTWKEVIKYIHWIFLILFFTFIGISIYYKKYNTNVFKYGFTIMLVLWIIPIFSIIEKIFFYIYRLAE
jgi:hypothetical protein